MSEQRQGFNHNRLATLMVIAGVTFLRWAQIRSQQGDTPVRIVELTALRVLPLVLYLATAFLIERAFAGWGKRVSERVWEDPRALAQFLGALLLGAAIVIAAGR